MLHDKRSSTNLLSNMEVAASLKLHAVADSLHSHIHGLHDVALVLVRLDGVARGDGDLVVTAPGGADGVILTGDLYSLLGVAEGTQLLALSQEARVGVRVHWNFAIT